MILLLPLYVFILFLTPYLLRLIVCSGYNSYFMFVFSGFKICLPCVFRGFPRPYRQIPDQHHKSGHYCFLPHPFRFMLSLTPYTITAITNQWDMWHFWSSRRWQRRVLGCDPTQYGIRSVGFRINAVPPSSGLRLRPANQATSRIIVCILCAVCLCGVISLKIATFNLEPLFFASCCVSSFVILWAANTTHWSQEKVHHKNKRPRDKKCAAHSEEKTLNHDATLKKARRNTHTKK
jgi:hypothetical protein